MFCSSKNDIQYIDDKGFTLIEIMIVVAIIGILASIAISNYLHVQLKSKTAEAKMSVGGIVNTELTWFSEHDYYLSVEPVPDTTPVARKRTWVYNAPVDQSVIDITHKGTFGNLGYEARDAVYYNYAVSVGANASGIAAREATVDAAADLDSDGKSGVFALALADRVPVLAGKQSNGVAPKKTSEIEEIFSNEY